MARMILSMLGVALVILAVGCGSGSKHYTEEERARGEHCLDRVEGYIREDIQDRLHDPGSFEHVKTYHTKITPYLDIIMHLSDSEKRLFNVAERIAVIGSKIESLKSEVPLGDYGGPDFESTTYQWEEWNGVAMKYRAKNLGGALGLSTLHVVLYDTEHCVTGAVWSD